MLAPSKALLPNASPDLPQGAGVRGSRPRPTAKLAEAAMNGVRRAEPPTRPPRGGSLCSRMHRGPRRKLLAGPRPSAWALGRLCTELVNLVGVGSARGGNGTSNVNGKGSADCRGTSSGNARVNAQRSQGS